MSIGCAMFYPYTACRGTSSVVTYNTVIHYKRTPAFGYAYTSAVAGIIGIKYASI